MINQQALGYWGRKSPNDYTYSSKKPNCEMAVIICST